MTSLIRLDQLTKEFSEGGRARRILSACDFDFYAGEFAAIRGRSGSGKSTLLNLLGGIDTPTSGHITIDGVRLTALTPSERTRYRRDNLGFVFQFFNLIPTLTVLENVLLPAELAGRADPAIHKRALDLLARVNLVDRRQVFPDKLSGGEQQRIAIARALLMNPRVVLADEPTGNLDAKTGDDVLALLDEMTRQAGKTLIMVTHSHHVAQAADRVLTIREGKLVEDKA